MIIESKLSLVKLSDWKLITFTILSLQMGEVEVAKMLKRVRMAMLLYEAWVIDVHLNRDRVVSYSDLKSAVLKLCSIRRGLSRATALKILKWAL